MKRLRFTTLLMSAASAAVLATSASFAQERDFDIEPGDLATALRAYVEQSGVQLIFRNDQVRAVTTRGVEGELEPEAALDQLLAGTGFTVVRDAQTGAVALVETQPAARDDAPAQTGRVDVEAEEREVIEVRDRIVVTGTTIRGVVPDSSPFFAFSAEDIALSGATTLERFLETLPQNSNTQTVIGDFAANQVVGTGSQFRSGGLNLRGLGIGTTLVLLNGMRLTPPSGESVDTSLIPLSAVERVEVLPDGASAIYGSDAIGGVVNFILRDEVEGVEVSSSYGTVADGSHDLFQGSISAGSSWSGGQGFLSYSYRDQSSLGVEDRDFVSVTLGDLLPEQERHSVLGSFEQEVIDRLSLSASVFYTDRNQVFENGGFFDTSLFRSTTENEQVIASTSVQYQFSPEVFLDIEAIYTDLSSSRRSEELALNGFNSEFGEEGTAFDIIAKVDSVVFTLPAGDVMMAAGGGFSTQDYDFSQGAGNPTSYDRESQFVFVEGFLPIVGEVQDVPWVNRLELSAAVRYTEYSDFGGDATPRLGLLWSPVEGVNLRGTYSRSFRAPTLTNLNPSGGFITILDLAGFGLPDNFSDDGSAIILIVSGDENPDLSPEFADAFSLGFDFSPQALENLTLSGTYFKTSYEDRLGSPYANLFSVIFNPEDFPFAVSANPSLDVVSQILTNPQFVSASPGLLQDPTDPVEVAGVVTHLVDGRLVNLAESEVEGVDFSAGYQHDSDIGTLIYGLNISYTTEAFQRATPVSPKQELLDTVGNPTSLKGSASIGVQRSGFTGQLNINYVDSYRDVFTNPEASVDEWTTFDLNFRYEFDESAPTIAQGLLLSLNINNVLDEDPPFVGNAGLSGGGLSRAIGFDPANANPVGRFVTFGLRKSF